MSPIDLARVVGWLLHTRDRVPRYRKVGFTEPTQNVIGRSRSA